MGHKHSTKKNWTIEERASDAEEKVAQSPNIITRVRKSSKKYFNGQAIENDASMHQLQDELLAIDNTVKQKCFPRKKKKQSKSRSNSEEIYSQNEYYYDQNPQSLSDNDEYYDQNSQFFSDNDEFHDQNRQLFSNDDEYYDPSMHTYENVPIQRKRSTWQCKYCLAENKSNNIKCRCMATVTRF
ncbi:unnamed protein product [Adineta steineri]|uniref:RanBP2-type domain-containing protein n=1 Tax=Adineta steineri TaxID=433720 RepID=A0A815DWF5_9BILA|nr:unnamed protein product [Adineta steineri]